MQFASGRLVARAGPPRHPLAALRLRRPLTGRFDFHQVAREPPNLTTLHLEDIAENQGKGGPSLASRQDCAFRYDHLVLFDESIDLYDRMACKAWIDNVIVEGCLAAGGKHSRYVPFDIIRDTGQNGFAVRDT